jgi:hypothetical protein
LAARDLGKLFSDLAGLGVLSSSDASGEDSEDKVKKDKEI